MYAIRSYYGRPFWPVDRSTPAIATEIPEETALIISTSGSEGQSMVSLPLASASR